MKPLRKNPHIFDHLDVMKKRYVNIAISYKILHAIQTNLFILQSHAWKRLNWVNKIRANLTPPPSFFVASYII